MADIMRPGFAYKMESEPRAEVKRLSDLLDSKFQLPNGWKFGWDGLIGLIPGVGDVVTNLLSFYILYQGARLGCPPTIILRMALNILIDNVFDAIPLIGNIFDFMWKANNRNVALIEAYLNSPQRTTRTSRAIVIGTLLFAVLVVIGCIVLSYYLAVWLWGFLRPLF